MPELPEVETTRRGIAPHAVGRRVIRCLVREPRLRWPVPGDLPECIEGARVEAVRRRAKYLLLDTTKGTLLVHLGMSGSFRIVEANLPPMTHDHIDLALDDGRCLRFNDPRRFGSMHWLTSDAHPLLDHLGPEPLTEAFDGTYLHRRARGKKTPVKHFLMDARVVVGVGNIYANEALFLSGIRPDRGAGRISEKRFIRLAAEVKGVLGGAIEMGGTTLRDFVGGDGKPGYFAQSLHVYGRGGEPCRRCSKPLKEIRQSNRTTVFCTRCQT